MGLAVNGSSGTEEQQRAASPYHQITKDAPPLFLTHGENDLTVPVEHSKKMEQKARALLGDENVRAIYYEDAPHGSKAAYDTPAAMEAVGDFLTANLVKTKDANKYVNHDKPGMDTIMIIVAVTIAVAIAVTSILMILALRRKAQK